MKVSAIALVLFFGLGSTFAVAQGAGGAGGAGAGGAGAGAGGAGAGGAGSGGASDGSAGGTGSGGAAGGGGPPVRVDSPRSPADVRTPDDEMKRPRK
jgi:hypothetical protein